MGFFSSKKTISDFEKERAELDKKLAAQREIVHSHRQLKTVQEEIEKKKLEFKNLRDESKERNVFQKLGKGIVRAVPHIKNSLSQGASKYKAASKSAGSYFERLDKMNTSYEHKVNGPKKKKDPYDVWG